VVRSWSVNHSTTKFGWLIKGSMVKGVAMVGWLGQAQDLVRSASFDITGVEPSDCVVERVW
jgi:hypothetical protein